MWLCLADFHRHINIHYVICLPGSINCNIAFFCHSRYRRIIHFYSYVLILLLIYPSRNTDFHGKCLGFLGINCQFYSSLPWIFGFLFQSNLCAAYVCVSVAPHIHIYKQCIVMYGIHISAQSCNCSHQVWRAACTCKPFRTAVSTVYTQSCAVIETVAV